jgi:dTDP-4-dehydrorhamnose reductase
MRRNGDATGAIAEACAGLGVDLAVISTNEVFDGARTDGRGYRPDEPTNPINPYGASKLRGEELATSAMGAMAAGPVAAGAAIIRTTWLHGPPGNDFPEKIARAALRARDAGEPLRAVADEIGSPTWTPDLADAIVELIWEGGLIPERNAGPAIHHLVNAGRVSRAGWAREVLRQAGIDVPVVDVPGSEWPRASTPPRWAVLEPTPLPSGEPMRDWRDAFAHAVPALVRSLHAR